MTTMSECTCKSAPAVDEDLDAAVAEITQAAVAAAAGASDERYAGLETRVANLEAALADLIAQDSEVTDLTTTSNVTGQDY